MMLSKREAKFKLIKNQKDTLPISGLDIPWQRTDIMSGNCPKHVGVRLSRIDDQVFKCPKGGEVYQPLGSINNQGNRDNYYLGVILK